MIDPPETIDLAPIDADEDAMLWRTVRRLAQQSTRHALELIAQRRRLTRLEAVVLALVVAEVLRWLIELAR